MMTQDLTTEDLRILRSVARRVMRTLRRAIRQWWQSGCCDLSVLRQLEIMKAKLENFTALTEIEIRKRMIDEAERD